MAEGGALHLGLGVLVADFDLLRPFEVGLILFLAGVLNSLTLSLADDLDLALFRARSGLGGMTAIPSGSSQTGSPDGGGGTGSTSPCLATLPTNGGTLGLCLAAAEFFFLVFQYGLRDDTIAASS